jgi:hypothetical protein
MLSSSTKSESKMGKQVLPRGDGGGGIAQIMYIHVSKCKNNKIKLKKIIISQVPVAPACNPSFSGGKDQANSL